jgi:adenosylhomocysteine nucleosidase
MKIAILGAMDEEIRLLQQSLQNPTESQYAHLTVYSGDLNGATIALVKCGIGKVAASVATTLLIDRFTPDFVINTGSAGGFHQDLSIGDVAIGTEVRHHDADLTHFGYELGQNAGMPASFPCDPRLIKAAEKATTMLTEVKSISGLICTGDSFIGSDEAAAKLRNLFPEMCAVEMEGVAIGQSSYLLNTPFLVIRSLSDIAGTSSTVSFEAYLEKAAKHSAQLVMATISELQHSLSK